MEPLPPSKEGEVMPTKKTDIAWLAGIIDGEGCITVTRKYKSGFNVSRVSITNTDEGILCEIKRILEEWLVLYTVFPNNQKGKKPCYQIRLDRKMEAKFVLEKVMPYLRSVKRQKAAFFLSFVATQSRKDKKGSNNRKKVLQYALLRV